jgi:recombinational DNA repair ATPase RecF
MWVKSLQLERVKRFLDSRLIEFSKEINLLGGANNSGKSTVLRSIALLQPFQDHQQTGQQFSQIFAQKFPRSGATNFRVSIDFAQPDGDKLSGNV